MRSPDREAVRTASPLDQVIAELTHQSIGSTTTGEVKFCCPFHEDKAPSLRVNIEKQTYFCDPCHGGGDVFRFVERVRSCDFPGAMAFLIERAGLSGNSDSRVVATYDYNDESGTLLYQVCRFSPKDFRQRRPDGAGGWTWKLGNVRRVLFGVPELHRQRVAYITEGEKDALALRKLGLVATTNAGGAGKWRPDYVAQLLAAGVEKVVVVPDNDDPGRQHADTVARSCHAARLTVKVITLPDLPAKGDVSDWLAAGHSKDELIALVKGTELYSPAVDRNQELGASHDSTPIEPGRMVHLTPASTITIRPVRWFWAGRLPLGALSLLGGREGIGKTTYAYTLAAEATRGRLEGDCLGRPRAVIVAATEDSWEHTIVPRLMAAGADLELVYRVDVTCADTEHTVLSLPRDLGELRRATSEVDAALILLDPLLSRVDAGLDTHVDAKVRQALEPLSKLAHDTDACVLGLIHVNKSASTDVLSTLMASRAFAAVARAVLFVLRDPQNEEQLLLGQAKNNLGRMDMPTLVFRIVGEKVADTAEGAVWTGKIENLGEDERTIREAAEAAAASPGDRSAVAEAAGWLEDYLVTRGGSADSADIKKQGANAGHTQRTLQRAREQLGIKAKPHGFPRQTDWSLPVVPGSDPVGTTEPSPAMPTSGETPTVGTTDTTGETLGKANLLFGGLARLEPVVPPKGVSPCGGTTDEPEPGSAQGETAVGDY